MIITKTRFIEFSKCSKYFPLEKVKQDFLNSDMTYEEYQKEENTYKIKDIIGNMFEEVNDEIIDLTAKENITLNNMLEYYKQVEELASNHVLKQFGGTVISSNDTFKQKKFEFIKEDKKYICYVDVFNEVNNRVNIVEVKATTTKKYSDMKVTIDKEDFFLFQKLGNIYYLKEEIESNNNVVSNNKYLKLKEKLFDRYSSVGKYIFDLSIQRYFIEESKLLKDKEIHYYLAVLNSNYTFDGEYVDGKPNYKKDANDNEIVSLISLDNITKEYKGIVEMYLKKIEIYTHNVLLSGPLGRFCDYKGQTECKYFKTVCGKCIPKYNSSLNYMNNGSGFKDEYGTTHKGLDLINEGYYEMLDIPESWISNPNHVIQRETLKSNKEYINKEKIREMLNSIKYPIYHLDFETYNCPIPRFRGEKPYSQSVFEFSLHIERTPGICGKDKDNFVYLASSHADCREDLVKKLCELIKDDGTLLAQNVSFEKTRIKELANIFPQYRNHLLKIINNTMDLIYILRTNSQFYESIGYNETDSKTVNYYNKDMSGSYSIKKTLPVFSNLSYSNLDVKNGLEAIAEYGNYENMSEEEFRKSYNSLVEYCKQDTWAMVVILNAVREKIK